VRAGFNQAKRCEYSEQAAKEGDLSYHFVLLESGAPERALIIAGQPEERNTQECFLGGKNFLKSQSS
jgi:hypothetical protein